MLGIEKKLTSFQNKLITKASELHIEAEKLKAPPKGAGGIAPPISQENAVKLAQMTIRALVLLDIADIIEQLVKE